MRVERQTSSAQQQVGSGMGTGSGFSGLQLKLSPEPRVEQGHAQEVKPAHQRKKRVIFYMIYNVK